jgi:hypothetical protein
MGLRLVVTGAAVGGLIVLGAACTSIDGGSQCQIYVPDPTWARAGITQTVVAPPPAQCPLHLSFFGVQVAYLARIVAPYGTPALIPGNFSSVITNIYDVNESRVGISQGYFGVGTDNKEHADDQGSYNAGQGGGTTTRLQQDHADSYIDLSASVGGGRASSTVFLPYTCCPSNALVAALPSVPRNTTVTVRTWTTFQMPQYAWWVNGVEQWVQPPGLVPPVRPGAVYSKLMSTPGTFAWKININGSFPGQSKTLQFNMTVR